MDLGSCFRGLLHAIEPSDAHVGTAKAAHERLRDLLRDDPVAGEAHQETYLSGSYARHTAIKNINDVDVICVLDIDIAKTEPASVLAWLVQSIRDFGDGYKKVEMQGRSVGITTGKGFCLDVVPGAPQQSLRGPLWIPDREARMWVPTDPKGQIGFAQRRNDSTDGFYVQIVKILKHWRDRLPTERARPRSYVLEALIGHIMPAGAPVSHASAIVGVLEGVLTRYGAWAGRGQVPSITDPAYPTITVSKRWTSAEFDAFMIQIQSAEATARNAREEPDAAKSLALWRRLFGREFAPAA
jgi:hypothetical protein